MIRTCYSRDELQAFTLGKLSESEAQSVEEHIDSCSVCEETVAILDDATDSLLRELRTGRETANDELPCEAEYERAVRELHDIDFVGSLSLGTESSVGDVFEPSRLRDYELLEPLGYGGMGTVYRARHTRLEKMVAVKLLPARRVPDEVAVTRFRREMRAIGQLDHPSIVRATDAGEVDGHHFLAMELVDGADLGKLVRQTGSLSTPNASELVRLAAIGMQYAHDRGIVHRDLKPSNLMLTQEGTLKILDLGLALLTTGGSGTVDELTTVGQLMGTLDYMAPEQFGDSHAVDQRVDVYSLGATLYKLLTGLAPYSGERYRTPLQKLRGLAVAEPIDIRQHIPDISPQLAETIHGSLARDVEQRIQSTQELAERLEPHCDQADLLALWNERSSNIVNDSPQATQLPAIREEKYEASSRVALTNDSKPTTTRESQTHRDDQGGYAWRTALAFFAASVLGLVFFIQTNRGTLKVESPRDDLSLEILRAGKPYKSLSLSKAPDSWTLGLGDYEVRLKEKLDGLKVVDGTFTLRRGEEHVVTISQIEADSVGVSAFDQTIGDTSQNSVDAALSSFDAALVSQNGSTSNEEIEPTYEGLTFNAWRQRFLTERSPKMRGQSAQAMLALADNAERQQRAIEAVFTEMTSKERKIEFEDGIDGGKISVDKVISNYLRERPIEKLFALPLAMKNGFENDVTRVIRSVDPPTDESTQKLLRDLIETGLKSESDPLIFAACALKHAEWLGDVPEQLRAAAANSDAYTKAHLTLMNVALNSQNESEIRLLGRLLSEEPERGRSQTARTLAYAGLLWLGPQAAIVADDVIRDLNTTPTGEDFYLVSSQMSLVRLGIPTVLQDLPQHLRADELAHIVGLNSRTSCRMRDVLIATLGCMGPQAKQAVPVLLEQLKTQVNEEQFTWFSAVKHLRRHRSLQVLAFSLQNIAPERFPNKESVWKEVLGEKRIPYVVRFSPNDLPNDHPLATTVANHIDETLDRYPIEYEAIRARQDEIRLAISDHPSVGTCVFNFSSGEGFEFFVTTETPRVQVKADKLYLLSGIKGGYVLDPSWYTKSSVEILPKIEIDGLKPTELDGKIKFESEKLDGAIGVAKATSEFNGRSPLTMIRIDPKDENQFRLENEQGTWSIRWGHSPAKQPIGEQSIRGKLSAVGDVLARLYREGVSQEDEFEADVRFADQSDH